MGPTRLRRKSAQAPASAARPAPEPFRTRSSTRQALWAGLCAGLLTAGASLAQTIDLYVDQASGQVFTQPAPGRSKLGTFERVDGAKEAAAKPVAESAPAPAPALATTPPSQAPLPVAASTPVPAAPEQGDASVIAAVGKALKGKWYERLSLRGYTQFRYNFLLDKSGSADWFMPTDRSVSDDNTFFIRRARLILSGDVTDHLSVYVQPDLNAAPTDGDFSVQLRDVYADISIDKDKEFRFRVGQSKVPFGWVNLQSSQNRLMMERPDALNSAVEGERDIGVFFYWAPKAIRDRFRDLVRHGLKGSGDYGVFAFGAYSGQGLNRSDRNESVHWVARLSYPFEFGNGQILEPSVEGYWGNFVPRTSTVERGGLDVTPTAPSSGVTDRRLGGSLVLYPQPIGIEAAWNFGEGPELTEDFQRIESDFLHGGYLQLMYKYDSNHGPLIPFVRWQYYDGGRKFARNAPDTRVDEWDFGVEWSPLPELELMTAYTYTPFRTNTSSAEYVDFKDASRLGVQLQWNY